MSIAKLWAKKIEEGKRTIEEVPLKLKAEVLAILQPEETEEGQD